MAAQTLQYRLEQNQAEQKKLIDEFDHQHDRASQKAIFWIKRKEPETAAALVYKEIDLIFQELCRVYDTEPWEKLDNDLFLNNIWLPKETFAQRVSYDTTIKKFLYIKALRMVRTVLFFTIACAWLSLLEPKVVKFILTPGMGLILLYLVTLLIRVILKVYVVRKNLVWYAPICSFYQFQNRYEANITQLKKEEEELQKSIQNIDAWELERFRDDAKWLYNALNSAPGKVK